jgi:prepilin-type N-terminal cleavage/methylation domain-containing protein
MTLTRGRSHKRLFDYADQKGFTIIEVLIVLAIAALILLIVFLALPALQRNAHNTSRKEDASLLYDAINECLENNAENTSTCENTANVDLPVSEMTGYTGFHYGADPPAAASSCGNGLNGLPVTPGTSGSPGSCPPSTTQPNYLFGLVCVNNGTNFATGISTDFIVSYLIANSNGTWTSYCIGT